MLKKLMILPIAAGLLAVNAGAACTETMKITTAAELNGFAVKVNGGNSTLCGVLANDIEFNTKQVVNNNKDDLAGDSYSAWTPIQNFAGTFDGQGFTIKGLYATGSEKIGFVGSTSGDATIKNLNIVDSYFSAQNMGAGIVADVYGGTTTIDNCSFDGLVYYKAQRTGILQSDEAQNLGGLVGYVSKGSTLNLSNSANKANVMVVDRKAALIGTSQGGSGDNLGGLAGGMDGTANISNCVTSGKVSVKKESGSTYDQVVGNVDKNATLEAENISCVNCSSNTVSGVEKSASLDEALEKQAEVIKDQQAEAIKNLPEATGVTFEFNSKNILEATIADGIDAFNVPENIEIGVVKFAREFTAGVHATIMLPFSIPVSEVSGGAFYKATSVAKDGTRWNAELTQENTTLQAYTPYVFVPSATSLTFNVPVELVQTPSSDVEVAVSGNWVMRGLVNTVILREGDERIGKAYGYASKAMDVSNVVAGQFVKMGKNSGTRALRAYLFYKGDAADLVIAKVLGKVSATASLSAEELPSAIEATFIDKEVVVYNRPEEVIASIVTVEAEEVEDGEDAMSLTKHSAAPVVEQSNRWVDLKGRSMNRKPSARGVYINKKSPAVVK